MKTITIKTDGNTCCVCEQTAWDEESWKDYCKLGLSSGGRTKNGVLIPSPDCPGSGEYVLVEKQKHLNMEAQICDMETGGDE